jgi:hypothetical protein
MQLTLEVNDNEVPFLLKIIRILAPEEHNVGRIYQSVEFKLRRSEMLKLSQNFTYHPAGVKL